MIRLSSLRPVRDLAGDKRGVSAVEFALIAPILMFFYFGLCEFCQAYMAIKRISHVASATADLVSQTESINTAGLNDVFAAGRQMMAPFPTAPLKQRITSVTANSSGSPRVTWSVGSGLSARSTNSTVSIPSGLIAANESVIMAEVEYSYVSNVKYFLKGSRNFTKTYYLRPRRSDSVVKTT